MENRFLKLSILRALKETYLSTNDIFLNLKENHTDLEQKIIYPLLSQLQIQNLLLSNWMPNNKGISEKYYYITKNGLNYIQQNV